MKRIIALILASVMIFSFAACTKAPENPDTPDVSDPSDVPDAETEQMNAKVALSTENYTVTFGMLSCYFYDFLANFYNTYYTSLVYMGLDFSKPLKEQIYHDDVTWYDFFMDNVLTTVEEMLLLAEAAHKDGLNFSEKDTAAVDAGIANIKAAAANYGLDFKDYIERYYYEGVTEQVLRDAFTLSNFAYSYYATVAGNINPTDEQCIEYRDEHLSSFYACDYYGYLFTSKEDAEKLCENPTAQEFMSALAAYLLEHDEELSAEDAAEIAADTLVEEYYYSDENVLEKWLFADGRQACDKAVLELETDDGVQYAVVYMAAPFYLVGDRTVDVRHILIMSESYDSDSLALEKAEQVYDMWKTGAADEELFAKLAGEFSEDGGSSSNGGLYENVTYGYMVAEFNDWIFDTARVSGDHGIVKTQFGYHIMYYVGSTPVWMSTAENAVANEIYARWLEGIASEFKITTDETLTDGIDA